MLEELEIEKPPTMEEIVEEMKLFRNSHWNRRKETELLPENWP